MKQVTILAFSLCITLSVQAQGIAWQDTIPAAIKTDRRRIELDLGNLKTGLEGIRSVVSPMGEGDPIRWAQGLPGVATGADGGTAIYVRGGNSGNNLFSLDGVPVYGYSHILGLTTIVPTEVLESVELGKGGFDGGESNYTASHLRITTKTPAEPRKWSLSLNNFLAGAGAQGSIGKKVSYLFSARISPLTWEYRTIKKRLPEMLGGLDNFTASVGDVYGKLHWRTSAQSSIDASFLGSLDRYGFDAPDTSHELMEWHNLVGLLRYRREIENMKLEICASANAYGSSQEQNKLYRDVQNYLSLRSNLSEHTLMTQLQHLFGDRFSLNEGLNIRFSIFSPGQVASVTNRSDIFMTEGWLQADYSFPESFALKAALRGHYYKNLTSGVSRIDPGASITAKWNLTRWLSFELTGDRLVQYYHTLEGLPVGWSLDLIVPTGPTVAPERAWQGTADITVKTRKHVVSAGAYYKEMDGLVYYKYAQSLFSGALAAWEDHVDIGRGTAFGGEFLYEYQGEDLYARVAYTLSKTTRHDFLDINEGQPFHARFDRRHMLNTTAQWKGFSATLVLQSGHWENGAAETYAMHVPGATWTADYYSGVNNFHMPTVFRLDLGYELNFKMGTINHKLNLGVCNVTNHFNPFMLYFDTRTESWKEIGLLPIMPNFSWRLEF